MYWSAEHVHAYQRIASADDQLLTFNGFGYGAQQVYQELMGILLHEVVEMLCETAVKNNAPVERENACTRQE